VAEAAKIIENTQRDLNIALMNELSIIFDKIGINTFEVLEAGRHQMEFFKISAGPGRRPLHRRGPVLPYLQIRPAWLQFKVILAGRTINDGMAQHIARKVLRHIIGKVSDVKASKVLVMGATLKKM
jgi:UDP-N-acetyl-D-galactosamine dehydrogenase